MCEESSHGTGVQWQRLICTIRPGRGPWNANKMTQSWCSRYSSTAPLDVVRQRIMYPLMTHSVKLASQEAAECSDGLNVHETALLT